MLRRWLSRSVWGLVALLLLIEEWLWDSLQRGMRRLALWLRLQALERVLRGLPAWASLLVLLCPALLLLPFKLAALWALGHGHIVLGAAVFVLAKLTGTALAAYLFDLVRDSARRIAWFDALYRWIMALLARARAWVQAQPAYQRARAEITRWRCEWQTRSRRSWWARRRRILRKR